MPNLQESRCSEALEVHLCSGSKAVAGIAFAEVEFASSLLNYNNVYKNSFFNLLCRFNSSCFLIWRFLA